MRVEVARVGADGSVRRTALDTADWDDAARWDELVAQADLASPPPYRPVPHQSIYLIHACDREFAITEHDLTGPMRELVMAVLAEGEAPNDLQGRRLQTLVMVAEDVARRHPEAGLAVLTCSSRGERRAERVVPADTD